MKDRKKFKPLDKAGRKFRFKKLRRDIEEADRLWIEEEISDRHTAERGNGVNSPSHSTTLDVPRLQEKEKN